MVEIISDSTPTFLVTLPAPPANVAFPGDVVEILNHDTGEVLETYVLTAVDTTRRTAMVTVLPAMADGVYSFSARLRRGGSLSASSEVDVVRIDTQLPGAPTLALHPDDDKGGGIVVQPRPRFIVGLPAGLEAGDSAALWLDDLEDPGVVLTAGDIAAGEVEIQSAAVLAVGLHVAYARITDQAGNEGPASNVVGFELTAFAGAITSASAPAGGLTVEKPLAGGIASSATPAGDMHVADQVLLEGAVDSAGAPGGDVTVDKALSAAVATSSALAGGLAVEKPLAGGVVSQGVPAGDLTVVPSIELEADVASAAAPAATATVEKPLAAAVASSSQASGVLTVDKQLAAAVATAGAPAGDLHVASPAELEAAVASAGAPAATATVEKPLAAAVASSSEASGVLTVDKQLAAAVATAGAPAGDLHVASPAELEADVASAGAPAASATVEKPISAALASSSAPAGGLTVAKSLAAAVATSSTPAGDAAVERAMQAGVVSIGAPGGATVGAVEFATPTSSPLFWFNPGPSGASDSDKVTIVAWYRLLSLPSKLGDPQTIFNIETGTGTDSLQLIIDSNDFLRLRSWNYFAGINLAANVAETLDGKWHCVMGSFDGDLANAGAAAFTHLWRDDVNILAAGASPPVGLPDLTRPMKVGGRTSAGNTWPYRGQLALVWYNHGIALDFSDAAIRAKFFRDGNFVPVGANGELPTGVPPRICMQGGAVAFKDNVGLGSDPNDAIGSGLVDALGPQDAESGLTVEPAIVPTAGDIQSSSTPAGGLTVEKPLTAALASSSAPAGQLTAFSDTIRAVVYDGASDFLVYEAATHGAADGTAISIAGALKSDLDGVEQVLFAWGGAVPGVLKKNADNTFSFIGGAAGAVFSVVTAAVPASVGDCIVLADANGTTAHLYILHAGGLVTGVNTPGSAATLTLATDWHFGQSTAAGSRLSATVAMWWVRAAALDFSVANNREQFWDTTAHKLRNPGPTGANPLDGAGVPHVFNIDPAATHGAGADQAGTFEDGTSPGTYADDFVPAPSTELALVDSAEDDSGNTASSTFTARSFGAAAEGRVLYVVAAARASVSVPGGSPDVTLNGDAMTLIGSGALHQVGSGSRRVDIYSIAQSAMTDPDATSGDIVVTYAQQHRGKAIAVYRGVGYSASASDTLEVEGATDPLTGSLDVAANGMVLAGAAIDNNSAISWTAPLAQDDAFDVLFNGSKLSFASADGLSAGPVTVEADPAVAPTTLGALFAATFDPV